jgi:LacI family transcriptional regulator
MSDSSHRTKSTVSDVAVHAKVSVATVSRSFNTPDVVRSDVRERVFAAAKELGYAPNAAAKALRMARTHIVGAAIPTLNYDIFARLINAYQMRLSQAGYMVFLMTVGWDSRDIYEPVRQLVDRGAEALLIVGRITDERLHKFLIERHIPTVTTYSYQSDSDIPSIGFDNYAATQQLVEYVIGLGHRNIVMMSAATVGNDRQAARVRAFKDVTASAGLKKSSHVIERVHGILDGAAAMRTIHATYPETTAVICNSDVLAFGALAECRKLGLKIPGDVTITGFDDQEMATLVEPPLTTITVPAFEMGERAADALIHAVTSNRTITSVRIETSLIIRASSGPPRS